MGLAKRASKSGDYQSGGGISAREGRQKDDRNGGVNKKKIYFFLWKKAR